MKEEIFRNYLEIKSLEDFKEVKKPSENYSVDLVEPKDFQLNKFFYKNVGKKYNGLIDLYGQIRSGLIMYLIKNFLLIF